MNWLRCKRFETCLIRVVTWQTVRSIAYHRRVVIGLLVAVILNCLRCEKKSTATLVTAVMQHVIYASMAQHLCKCPIWLKKTLLISVEICIDWMFDNFQVLLLRRLTSCSWLDTGDFIFDQTSTLRLAMIFWWDVSDFIQLDFVDIFSSMTSDDIIYWCSSTASTWKM